MAAFSVLKILAWLAVLLLSSTAHAQDQSSRPTFARPVANLEVEIGGNATLECVVGNIGDYQVAWEHFDRRLLLTLNGDVITRDKRVSLTHPDSRTWLLHIRDLQPRDGGQYMCQITTRPLISREGYVKIVAQDQSTTPESPMPTLQVEIGGKATLECVVDYIGNYTVAWIHTYRHRLLTLNGDVITKDERVSVSRPDSRTWLLHLRDARPIDSGHYKCVTNTQPRISGKVHLRILPRGPGLIITGHVYFVNLTKQKTSFP